MANEKWSHFPEENQILPGDTLVGLRNDVPGLNTRFISQLQQVYSVRVYCDHELDVTYNNGTAGVGAYIEDASGTFGDLTIDGKLLNEGDRFLVPVQTDATENGIYELANQGDGVSVPWKAFRATDFTEPGQITAGRYGFTEDGNDHKGARFCVVEPAPLEIGVDTINFARAYGTIAYQDADDVEITGGKIDNTNIGLEDPGTGVFSNLSWPTRTSLISVSTPVVPEDDLCSLFQVDTASVVISAEDIGNYQTDFQFWIKNTSAGNISFTPDTGDTIEGESTLIILPGECVQINKSLTAGEWQIISNFNTSETGDYLVATNNLSDLSNNLTAINNLQLANGVVIINETTDLTMVNSSPNPGSHLYQMSGQIYVTNSKGSFQPITLTLAAMNATTPGAKSVTVGQTIYVKNSSDGYDAGPHAITINDNAGGGITILQGGEGAYLTLWDNATAAGQWFVQKIANAATRNTTSTNTITHYYVPVLTNSSKVVNNLAAFDDVNGSLKDSGVSSASINPITTATVTTTNATPTVIASIAVPVGQQITIIGTFNAVITGASGGMGGYLKYAAHRPSAGDVTQITAPEYWQASTFGSGAVFVGSANTGSQTVDITVTGVAATTIKWSLSYHTKLLAP